MIDVLGNFQKNKLTFITAGFSVFTFLRDIEDMITHFFSNLKYLLIAFGFLLIVLIYNSLRRKTMFKDSYKESEDSPHVFQHIKGRSNSIKKISFKIAIVFCTAFFIFGLLSLSYVKNYPIYG